MKNFQNKYGSMGCIWSRLNAPGTGNPLSLPVMNFGSKSGLTNFLISPLRLGVSRTFLAFSRLCKYGFFEMNTRGARGRARGRLGSGEGHRGREGCPSTKAANWRKCRVRLGVGASQQSDKKDDGMSG